MKKTELVVTLQTISAAKAHTCDYCGCKIVRGADYTRIETRLAKVERFPIHLRICKLHDVGLLPVSLLWKRK